MKQKAQEVLDRIESIKDGDYLTSVSEENWLADDFNPRMLVSMLEMAYQTGYTAAVEKTLRAGELLHEEASAAKWQTRRFAPEDDQ